MTCIHLSLFFSFFFFFSLVFFCLMHDWYERVYCGKTVHIKRLQNHTWCMYERERSFIRHLFGILLFLLFSSLPSRFFSFLFIDNFAFSSRLNSLSACACECTRECLNITCFSQVKWGRKWTPHIRWWFWLRANDFLQQYTFSSEPNENEKERNEKKSDR